VPRWANSPLVVYHGTDAASVGAIGLSAGIHVPTFMVDLGLCRPHTDFGQGFYTTTNLHQARQWANFRLFRAPRLTGNKAVVLEFELDRDWLSRLDSLAFVRDTYDYWDLVSDCRHGFRPHQRQTPNPPAYDVVYGPVSLWPQKLVLNDCDQISFHTSRAVFGLQAGRVEIPAGAKFP
jgi:hypothetical protein